MNRNILALILVSVLMSSLAQIVLKAGMSNSEVVQALAGNSKLAAIVSVASSPSVIAGLCIYFGSALIWLLVLARIEVSLAYPFVGLGFIVTMILGWWVHGDTITPMRVAGTLLIACGVIVLSRG